MPRVALLVNFIAPYRVPLFEALQSRVGDLRVFVSTPLEPNRSWSIEWGRLDVVVQRTVTFRKRWTEPGGFTEVGYTHVPYNTIAELRRYRPNAIIAGELGARTALAAAYARSRRGVRLVIWATVSERTESHRGPLRSLVRPRLLSQADAVLVNGRSGVRYVARLGVAPDRIVVAPYTTDPRAVGPAANVAGHRSRRLLYVGLLVQRKGLLPFLEALGRWAAAHPAQKVHFRIAGDGPERPALESYELPQNVALELVGTVPYARLNELYAAAGTLVLPTLSDEWGVVVNEAMAAGIPVLGSQFSQAVEELVVEGETGWAFRPDQPASVAGALDRALAADAEQLARMGAAARAKALELTPSAVADRIAGVLTCPSPLCS